MTSTPPRRAPRSRAMRTLNQLADAAIEIFENVGFHHAQVGDIAERAGVSRATFYNHFASKEELLRHMVLEAIPDLLATGVENHVSQADRVRSSTRSYLEAYQRNATLMHVWSEAAHRNPEMASLLDDARQPFLMRTEQSIRRLQERGLVDDLDATYAAYALTGMVSSFAYTWFVDGREFDAELAVDTLSTLWMRALAINPEDPA